MIPPYLPPEYVLLAVVIGWFHTPGRDPADGSDEFIRLWDALSRESSDGSAMPHIDHVTVIPDDANQD